jgi:hypothetical protein
MLDELEKVMLGRSPKGQELVEQHIEYDPSICSYCDARRKWSGHGGQTTRGRVLVAEIENKVVGFAYLSFEKATADLSGTHRSWKH